jgi:Amt family ammonium transporter
VHVNAGIAALVAAIVVGKRRDYPSSGLLPHNVPFTLLGAGMLWFGWFGFNAAARSGRLRRRPSRSRPRCWRPAGTLVVWTLLDLARRSARRQSARPPAIVVGLVAITPAAGFVGR